GNQQFTLVRAGGAQANCWYSTTGKGWINITITLNGSQLVKRTLGSCGGKNVYNSYTISPGQWKYDSSNGRYFVDLNMVLGRQNNRLGSFKFRITTDSGLFVTSREGGTANQY